MGNQNEIFNGSQNVLILLSGGIDSSSCVEYYKKKHFFISALFIDYEQPDSQHEFTAATSVAQHYSIPLNKIKISGLKVPKGYIPGRNAMLLTLALMDYPFDKGLIAIGIHSGTEYKDCSKQFHELMQKIYVCYEEGKILIDAPFLNWEKSEIIDFAMDRDVPLNLTFSTNIGELPIEL